MKTIHIILAVMIGVTIFNLLFSVGSEQGFGYGVFSFGNLGDENDILYDDAGRAVCYRNGTGIEEEGRLEWVEDQEGDLVANTGYIAYWYNTTDLVFKGGSLYTLPYWENEKFGLWENPDQTNDNDNVVYNFFVGSPIGFLAAVTAVMIASSVVGLKIFGSGISEFSVATLVKGGFYLGMFGVCSAGSYSAIISIPLAGVILYFVFTAAYALLMVHSFSGGGGGD